MKKCEDRYLLKYVRIYNMFECVTNMYVSSYTLNRPLLTTGHICSSIDL